MKTTAARRDGFSILKFLLGTVLVLVVAVLVFLTFLLSPVAKWAANSQLPGILGTDASIKEINIGFWSGDLEIKGVSVSDPADESGETKLFSLDRLKIDIDPLSLFSDVIHVKEFTVDAPAATVQRLADGSFSFEKLKIMEQSATPEPPVEDPATEKSSGGKGVRIDTIAVNGLSASFFDKSNPVKTTDYHLKDFSFRSSGITVNPGSTVADLSPGIELDSVVLSDAQVEYLITALKEAAPQATDAQATETQPTKAEEEKEIAAALEPTEEQPAETSPADPILIHLFEIKNFAFHYKDTPFKGDPLDVRVVDFFTKANDLLYDPSSVLPEDKDKVITASLGFQVPQKTEGFGPASLSGVAKSSVVGDGIPVTAGSIQLTGFELATLGTLVPQGTQTAIGGPAFDLAARWFVSPDQLIGEADLVSINGTKTSITIGGTPDNPTISGSELLLGLVARPGTFVANLAGDTLKGGVEIVAGAADAAGQLAKGAGDTVLGFGKGLLKTGSGLLTGDLKKAGEGLNDATIGTVTTAGTAVADSTVAAASGVKGAADAGGGTSRRVAWIKQNQKRHDAFDKAAQEWLENGIFPPDPADFAPKAGKPDIRPVSAERGDKDARRAAEAVAKND